MKLASALFTACVLACSALAQTPRTSATVPITLDHNRIIIDVRLPLPDGTTTRVRGWVDTGNPEVWITERLAKKLGLQLSGLPTLGLGGRQRVAELPRELLIGGMAVSLAGATQAHAVLDRQSIGPGLSAEINLPSTILRNYDVVVDYPNREFTIAAPGVAHFGGTPTKATVNPRNGLIQIPGNIAGEKQNLGLDLGATVSFISSDLVEKWRHAHPQWPQMTGAVGPANSWGLDEEPHWELLRVPRMQDGGISLTGILVVSFPKQYMEAFGQRAGLSSIALVGTDALLNYRVGLDYAHSTVYFQQLNRTSAPDMDVVGLVLRPEPDGRYTVLGIAEYEGKPSVPEVEPGDVLLTVDNARTTGGTLGQVWSMLGGRPGDVRALTLDRAGKQFTLKATVHRFLSAEPVTSSPQKQK